MKRSTKIVLGTIIGVGLVSVVTAKQFGHCDNDSKYAHGFGDGHRAEWVSKRVAKHLDLNTAQQETFDQLKDQAIEEIGAFRAERAKDYDIQALFNTQFDQTKAMQLLEQRTQMIQEHAPELISAFAKFYDGLDASQQVKVSEALENRMEHRGKGWGHRGGFFHE